MNFATKFIIKQGIKCLLNNAFMIHAGSESMCHDCEPFKCLINTRKKIDIEDHDNNARCDKCGHLLNRHFD